MLILGIVGSPRKTERTNALVGAILEGAAAAGAETRIIYLVDYALRPHGTAGAGPACPRDLSDLCNEADALTIGAPVYWGDINGLTKDFIDTVQLQDPSGMPAAAVAIAGGSGKGLLSGLQNLYHFLYHRQYRAIDPTPVSRFNFDATLVSLRETGSKLAGMAQHRTPFAGGAWNDRWADVLAHYTTLPYLTQGPLDEFILVAQQLIAISDGDKAERARQHLDSALSLKARGQQSGAAHHAVQAYKLLFFEES